MYVGKRKYMWWGGSKQKRALMCTDHKERGSKVIK